MKDTKEIIKRLADLNIHIDGSTEGRDLGIDRGSRACTLRRTRHARKKKAWAIMNPVRARFR
eukprot:5818160-Pyramimonas_sp.AAC.1